MKSCPQLWPHPMVSKLPIGSVQLCNVSGSVLAPEEGGEPTLALLQGCQSPGEVENPGNGVGVLPGMCLA
jgi:hypothetical protein